MDEHSTQRVAIKLIRRGGRLSRDHGEARLASLVRSRHVVAVYDSGRLDDGAFLVMELVQGPSLQFLVSGGGMPWRDATSLLIDVCEGVMAVHDRGIIHCDLKPANLLLHVGGMVKVADFGLACRTNLHERSRRRSSWRDQDWHEAAGTPHYMSPEQCCADRCDERSDIYSLGATYFALLTGRTPYARSGPFQIMCDHLAAPVPDPRGCRRGIPRACADIVIRAMAKARADRYGSVREMQSALRGTLGRLTAWRINQYHAKALRSFRRTGP